MCRCWVAEERECSREVFEGGRRFLKEGSESTGLVCAIVLYAEFDDGVTQEVEPGGIEQDLCEAAWGQCTNSGADRVKLQKSC